MKKVNLKELADQMDFMLDEWRHFLDKSSCEIISIDEQYLGYAEELDEDDIQNLPDWEQDEVRNGVKILDRWSDMLPLPDKRELGEYDMMSDFAFGFPDRHISDGLSIAVDGPGAFRRFKNALRRFNIEEDWYSYKEEAMLAFARQWCDENGIPYDLEDSE